MVLYVSNHGTFSMRLHVNLWSISQHIRSCYADQHALIGIWRYMYMPWPLNSWGNDGVSTYSYCIKVPIPTWPIMIHHDESWPIMIPDFYADSIWFCCFFFHPFLQVSSRCEAEIWQLLLQTSPRILWLDFGALPPAVAVSIASKNSTDSDVGLSDSWNCMSRNMYIYIYIWCIYIL